MPWHTSAPTYGDCAGYSWPSVPPRLFGFRRKPWPYLPEVNMRFGLIRTGLAEPRSLSGTHQLSCQSAGWKAVGEPRAELVPITESLLMAPSHGIALPVAKKT